MGLFLDMHIDCAALKIHFKKWDLCSLAIKGMHCLFFTIAIATIVDMVLVFAGVWECILLLFYIITVE